MSVFEFALELEQEHYDFYLSEANIAEDERLKKVFMELADEEKKHKEIVKKLAEDKEIGTI